MTKKQDTVKAFLSCSLDIECTACHENIDLLDGDNDEDYIYCKAIFGNDWESLIGDDIECPFCGHELKIGKVEY